ncbi:ferrous iron transport protein B [Hoylesella nanceiensis]|uniref:ferrous iron transport protein B n=1 Tax=Hoylesella nanceiensis TaxID=425941 RepID=UPI001CB5B746|nr:ferrous iron transport protein B [Hoylesella nanceiensis]MBF1429671.1 ferrous iron transport protein B [Hoylesella nanceiensis]
MRLADLKTGEKGIIIKVVGHGSFRKRIIEMGFIKGKEVEVLLNAPLQDPVKYRVMGYEVSLRRNEAKMIQIVTEEEQNISSLENKEEEINEEEPKNLDPQNPLEHSEDNSLASKVKQERRQINIALVGNPNCGKTSLFNFASGAHERVGNYSGVTVDAKEGKAFFEGYQFNIVDLPGTYSLSAYSPEELYVRKQLIEETPDVIINILDSSNLERNLYLTTQLIDLNLRMVCALNMYDEAEKRGDNIDYKHLGSLLGVPMVPTVFTSGRGVKKLFHIIINTFEGSDYLDDKGHLNKEVAKEIKEWHDTYHSSEIHHEHDEDFASGEIPKNVTSKHIHINYGQNLEEGISKIQQELKQDDDIRYLYSTRYLAIKLLEQDKEVEEYITKTAANSDKIIQLRDNISKNVASELHEDSETAIMDAKYTFIHDILQKANYKIGKKENTYNLTHKIDNIITNKWIGIPIFIAILWLMFQTTFTLGQYPMDWLEEGINLLGGFMTSSMEDGPLKSMLVDGIIGGVGAVIVFLPQILILYTFISFMEDSGYMARAAFIMDRLMNKMGLHGKSFIPLIMGFGCNVPAIMSTRTIESRQSRLVTTLILPLMSCSARLPIYIMIIATFFAPKYRSSIMISLYVIGMLIAVIMSKIFTKTIAKNEDTPFVMELPPYRFPTWKAIGRHTWEKGKQYLKKMGGIILIASIIVWTLGYFPHGEKLDDAERLEQSYIGKLGKTVEPLFRAQGFDWKLDVGLLAGTGAKEIVASTMGVIYTSDSSFSDDNNFSNDTVKYSRLYAKMRADGITPISAYAFLLFVLLYFPCVATIAAIKNETGSWKWALFTVFYTSALAWVVSAAFYQIMSRIFT